MKKHALYALAFVASLGALPSAAGAQTINPTTAGGPTWNRPLGGNPPTPPLSAVGTAVPYVVIPLTVDVGGSYVFLNTATNPVNWDNYSFLYQNSFDPTHHSQAC